jgi:nucleotide-binding universal stress UspA family protein
MINKILFPVDFSSSSTAMAPYVRRVADLFGSDVTLVHVCDLESHNGFELSVRSPQEIAETHEAIAHDQLESFLLSEFPRSSRVLCSGEAASQIAKVAKTCGFDLIVMPTHAGRFRRMLLGSTTAKVLDDASCQVLTTEHAESTVPRPLEHRVWVCALSLGPDSERVLRIASHAAAEVRAKLSLVHVIDGPDPARKEAVQRLTALRKTVGCEATISIAAGPIKDALLEEARRWSADAVVIGRTLPSGALGRMRDLTYGIVRDSPFPVLSV